MKEKRLAQTEYLTMKQFQEQIIPWSPDTIRRRINDEGLPAIKDTSGFLFHRPAVIEWFKRRQFKVG